MAIHVISLGAGVQSTTMALMAAHGELAPMPAAAIFADTGAEPSAVYRHLDWLEPQLPFPVHRVQWRNLRDDLLASVPGGDIVVAGRKGGFVAVPFHTVGENGKRAILRRDCTKNYKIMPIHHELKRLLGIPPEKRARAKGGRPLAVQWLGISSDEWTRAKRSRVQWVETRHPLIEGPKAQWISRSDCLDWMKARGYPEPPSSACTFCPYRSAKEWARLRASPEDFADAVRVDEAVRDMPATGAVAGLRMGGKLYVHSSGKPLKDVSFVEQEDEQYESWNAECDGVCGV